VYPPFEITNGVQKGSLGSSRGSGFTVISGRNDSMNDAIDTRMLSVVKIPITILTGLAKDFSLFTFGEYFDLRILRVDFLRWDFERT